MKNNFNKSLFASIKIVLSIVGSLLWIWFVIKFLLGNFSTFNYLFENYIVVTQNSLVKIVFDVIIFLMLSIYGSLILLALILSIGDYEFLKGIFTWRNFKNGILIPFSAIALLFVGFLLRLLNIVVLLAIIGSPFYFLLKYLLSKIKK